MKLNIKSFTYDYVKIETVDIITIPEKQEYYSFKDLAVSVKPIIEDGEVIQVIISTVDGRYNIIRCIRIDIAEYIIKSVLTDEDLWCFKLLNEIFKVDDRTYLRKRNRDYFLKEYNRVDNQIIF